MGYRSEVKGRIYGPRDKIDALIAKVKLSGTNDVFVQHEAAIDVIDVNVVEYEAGERKTVVYGCICLDYEDVKWYDGDGFTESWHDLETDARDLFELSYEFARVGEDYSDITYENGGEDCQDWLQPYSNISDDTPEAIEG